jgi:hypothetical protein
MNRELSLKAITNRQQVPAPPWTTGQLNKFGESVHYSQVGAPTAGSRRPILNSRGRGLSAFPLTQNSIQRDSTGRVAT